MAQILFKRLFDKIKKVSKKIQVTSYKLLGFPSSCFNMYM